MELEELLGRSLHDGLARIDVPAGDLAAVRASGTRLRSRRRGAVVTGVAVAVAVVSVSVAALGGDAGRSTVPDPAPPVTGAGAWERLPDAPVLARSMPLVGWTGEEVVVVGGDPDPCPVNTDCDRVPTVARDGAAYDVAGTWRVIAEAPVGMAYYFRTTMVGDTMVVFGDGRWWAYDAGDDAWTRLPDPPVPTVDSGSISSADGRVYALSSQGRVQVLDLAARTWSALPAGPRPLYSAVAVATTTGVAVSGGTSPRDVLLRSTTQIWDGSSWSELSTRQTNPFRHWTGERLVELDLQVANPDGLTISYGGRLDPVTGEWSPLPDPPASYGGDGWSLVAADGPLLLGWGFVYDDRGQTWTRVPPKPDEAIGDGASAVWVDGRVVVVDGVDPLTAATKESPAQAWVWAP
ncbi:hypothetical protein NPS01_26780 [Nocardioides psychrotolerans]|uniref:Uncharacterized protein n=1 Tax=Nocardioides psychrotolerans TaxID=1005945 RepID=A0A1I3MT12_9ACTN|nr:hypothetical protein [Nocardioides psychrotolerans]GEP39015.1 hypothetical protein NPS01_26780 [Nocardioides psychrotolerans]SFJ00244.1 hypothetical protein SAMN05216561_11631 [Nocardioides psychrotolerans]